MIFDDIARSFKSLLRRQNTARNARTAFVDAVEFSVAVSAFDIAFRGDGQMDPAESVLRFFGITRMSGNFSVNVGSVSGASGTRSGGAA